jgi:predicted RNase H-like nuclease (RuvC/YqgF family)
VSIPDDPVSLTYRELAERLGISIEAARIRVRRARWTIIPGNHPADPVHVLVPAKVVEKLQATPGRAPRERPPDGPPDNSAAVKAMEEHVRDLRTQLDRERARADRAEERADAARGEVQEARQEAREVRERADSITDRLTVLERTLEAAQDERDRFRAELEQARRPWWRRWRRPQ